MGTDGDRPFVGRGVEGKDSCHAGISWARPHRPHPPSNPLPFPGSSRATDPPASGKRNIEARGAFGFIGIDAGGVAEEELQDVIFLRSEEHTSELQSLMRISYAVF